MLPPPLQLTRLRDDHAPALLAFERENRDYFARSVPDRGDDYFTHFAARHATLLAEQEAGLLHFHLLVDDRGAVLGRVNLVDVTGTTADLGYRIAEHATGRGLAVAAVREICARAATDYGLRTLTAAATTDNPASQAVLSRNAFLPTGPVTLDGRPGTQYRRTLDPFLPIG
ncbi:GNAT family N-acetyltransferase [Streptomyces hypolithicus]